MELTRVSSTPKSTDPGYDLIVELLTLVSGLSVINPLVDRDIYLGLLTLLLSRTTLLLPSEWAPLFPFPLCEFCCPECYIYIIQDKQS